MNKYYSKKEIKKILQQNIELPNSVSHHMDEAFQQINNECEKSEGDAIMMKSKGLNYLRKIAAVAAIFVLCAGMTTAATAALIKWNSKVANKFEVNDEQQAKLTESGLANLVNVSDVHNGVTISAEQTLADEEYMYILFKITAPVGTQLSKDTGFNSIDITVEGKDTGAVCQPEWLQNENGTIEKSADNEMYLEVWVDNTRSDTKLQGKDIAFTFRDMIINRTNKSKPMIDGKWNISWNVNSVDVKNIVVNKEITKFDITIKEIKLSPLSMQLSYKKEYTDKESNDGQKLLSPVSFQLDDGSIIDIPNAVGNMSNLSSDSTFTDAESTDTNINCSFHKIIDIDKVTAVIFSKNDGGTTVAVPIK